MTEENLSDKMTEFMTTLDQIKKYRKLASVMTDFTLIIASTVAILLTLHIVYNMLVISGISFFSYENLNLLLIVDLLVFCVSTFLGTFYVSWKVRTVKTKQWQNTLNEGTPGALKLLQEINWEAIFSDIRFAKRGFAFYGILKVMAYWLAAVLLFVVMSIYIGDFFHFYFNFVLLLVLPLAFVLVLNMKDLRKRNEQVGRLDSLLWELQWFEKEFTGTDFQA